MEHAGSVAGWIHQVAGQMRSISLPILVAALALHTCEVLLNAAQAGTVAMLGIYRAQIQDSTGLGLLGAGLVQNALAHSAG
jgi:hypothetical protein